jgi:hypothetical protein
MDERAIRRCVGLARQVAIKRPTAVFTAEAAAAAILHTVKIGSRKRFNGNRDGRAQDGSPLCKCLLKKTLTPRCACKDDFSARGLMPLRLTCAPALSRGDQVAAALAIRIGSMLARP